ncbi:helix-turn-helix domain-containing protein [Clostridium saccharobutylicum]|uniref:HTH-type transcriptional regulator n=1 Tax=Clostridium saccharobutylicum DSM 13864 TaxID=1345695 RepID=U5MTZ8_CLOSA|nr:helix-turn-helix transcriptional regulator [Clostridium saccharobutylicum]AGX43998.1 HTH-type transcriptional regulator [Clostridium saccharobutylicum DSM 13864]AQR91291.1 HTH-type transcriptional regulator Xre [Clostridium saccharobutylicum]AQS01195.1 HTH-type transcriptional regulator Xre [Clostridium saccharobutylicum]AQS15178.1 HTH-type transcriptional regulator Xre [Clostridium saccharobutylicum]MBA2905307.1 transcriptional regulator with XRE-family HTH domain [Clostridium saccharobuty
MLGERIKLLRKDQGITQDQLAEYINVSRSSINGYENGGVEPSLSVLVKIADVFNVSLDYLLGRTEEKHNFNLLDKYTKEFLFKIHELVNNYKIIKK